ncbi:hypothetical protein MUK60_07665 [Streptomyces sp. LRE541]|uniref:hypothetical protein n=1 Tax=Streptomyces sp. LRE541 TaxID=2931983 RepID=UPI00200FE2BD|nr:hypothetical protein [Streptomyces sp. LRE541]UPZ27711.1 hypothetical protein MUK60_07665 [Streptomyces sp. LRE541]
MTTAVKPLPPHGSDARYKGNRTGTRPPCRCKLCTRGHRQADVQRELRRLNGERNLVPIGEVLPHIKMLRASGMSQTMIARQAGISQAVISYITTGRNKTCQTEKARLILAVQPRRFTGNAERPAIGSIRRVRALYSLGHSRAAISTLSGLSVASISLLAEGRWNVIDNRAATALAGAYQELAHSRGTNWQNQRRAAAEAWAPPGAWDDIDDPAAIPDWTGYCGTDRGYWTHQRQQLPMCPRCETAHQQWLAEHAHLTAQELNRARFAARNAAASREADLAHDARELMRVSGLDVALAAERLQVTRAHLQQALLRHPETAAAEQSEGVAA